MHWQRGGRGAGADQKSLLYVSAAISINLFGVNMNLAALDLSGAVESDSPRRNQIWDEEGDMTFYPEIFQQRVALRWECTDTQVAIIEQRYKSRFASDH